MKNLNFLLTVVVFLLINFNAEAQGPPPPPPPAPPASCHISVSPDSVLLCVGSSVTLSSTSSVNGSAINFSSNPEFVYFNNTASLTTYDNALTVSAWIKVINSDSNQAIVSFLSGAGNDGFEIGIFHHSVYATVTDSLGSTHSINGAGTVLPNTWTSIAFTYLANDSMKVFINGAEAGSIAVGSANIAKNSNYMTIGIASSDQLSRQTIGAVTEIRMYGAALNASEISTTYNVSQSGSISSLIGYWRCDEGSGSLLTDASPNANDGAVSGIPGWISPCTAPIIFPVLYNWTPSAGLSSSTASDVSLVATVTTMYFVTLTDTTTGCTARDSAFIHVNGPALPVSVTSTSNFICPGDTVWLRSAGFSNIIWSPGGITGSSAAVSPTLSTLFIANGLDSAGCPHQDSLNITVFPVIHTEATALPGSLCRGDSSTLSVSGMNSQVWSAFGSTSASVVVTPSQSTTYIVTGLDSNNCHHLDSIFVIVRPAPVMTVAANPAQVCAGDTTVISATGLVHYQWTPGSGNNAAVQVAPSVTTTYFVNGTDSNGCSAQDSISVTVNPFPATPVIHTSGDTLSTTSSGQYQWYRNDSLLYGAVSQYLIATESGSYSVRLTNASGCSAFSQLDTIRISGISDISSLNHIDIFPNPSVGIINIKMQKPESLYFILSDINGKLVIQGTIEQNGCRLDLSALSSGLYFLKLSSQDGTGEFKIIKE